MLCGAVGGTQRGGGFAAGALPVFTADLLSAGLLSAIYKRSIGPPPTFAVDSTTTVYKQTTPAPSSYPPVPAPSAPSRSSHAVAIDSNGAE